MSDSHSHSHSHHNSHASQPAQNSVHQHHHANLAHQHSSTNLAHHDPASQVQDYAVFGEFGEVNPSISDGSTFTFMKAATMTDMFAGEGGEGCFLYARHLNPSNDYLARALAMMEGSEAAQVTASGMGAISVALLQLCAAGDEIIAAHTIYGGTYALLKNFFPKLGINTHFVNTVNLAEIERKITKKTKVVYCETISNPLLEITDLRAVSKLCKQHGITFIVDNTFCPMLVSPIKLGADIVVYSLTKYINGSSDCVGGAVCGSADFINSLKSVNDGAAMLLGPVQDSMRSASILKNLRTLHIRMQKHSANAQYIAEQIEKLGLKVFYPGLTSHPQHELIKSMLNPGYGFSGMVTIDVKSRENAEKLVAKMQEALIGYFAVSLGFHKTLFSIPGLSTSSEIPEEEQALIGMTPSLLRISIGIDNDIERSFARMKQCFKDVGLI
jgi:methionine-gamma-lyase